MSEERNEFEERIQKGIAKLDIAKPGWEKLINLEHLDLGNNNQCVLGQLHESYHNGKRVLFEASHFDHVEAIAHGFYLTGSEEYTTTYARLTNKWKAAITKLLAEGRRRK